MLCELLSSLGDRRLLTVNKAIIVSGWSISRNLRKDDIPQKKISTHRFCLDVVEYVSMSC
jgi:hypothetical protein